MEIPPEKKPLFYLVSVPVFLVGLVIGALVIGYVFFKTKDTVCRLWQTPQVNTALTPNQIQQAVSLRQDRQLFGEVTSKDASSFTLQVLVTNPLDTKNSTTTTIKVLLNQGTDEVIILKQVSAAPNQSSVKEVKASFGDIKVGEQVLLKILDGKKTVYITNS